MICPQCGAENPDSAEFCSLCMQRLQKTAGAETFPFRQDMPAAVKRSASPGEWRMDIVDSMPGRSGVVEAKIRKFRARMAILTFLVLAVIAWLALSFTVWGNPSPGKRAAQLIGAINEREAASFTALFVEQEKSSAESLFVRVKDYLGADGEFRDVKFRVDKKDRYTAYVYLQEGTIIQGGGTSRTLSADDGLVVYLENIGGKWRVKVSGTKLIP